MNNQPEALGGLIGAVVADLGLTDKLGEFQTLQVWKDAVGPALAQHTRPIRVYKGRIDVAVPSAVWRNQLIFMKGDIIARINVLMGKIAVTELRLINQRSEEDPKEFA